MSTNKKYQPFFAAFLLALYAFVATPVQLWHQHTAIKITDSSSNNKSEASNYSAATYSTIEENCSICSHQYSTYSGSEPLQFDEEIPVIKTKNGFYTYAIPASALLQFSNKGPPARFNFS